MKESHEKYGTGADQDDIREEEVVIEVRKSGISRDSYVEMKALQNAMKGNNIRSDLIGLAEIRRRGVKRDEILKEAGILGFVIFLLSFDYFTVMDLSNPLLVYYLRGYVLQVHEVPISVTKWICQ